MYDDATAQLTSYSNHNMYSISTYVNVNIDGFEHMHHALKWMRDKVKSKFFPCDCLLCLSHVSSYSHHASYAFPSSLLVCTLVGSYGSLSFNRSIKKSGKSRRRAESIKDKRSNKSYNRLKQNATIDPNINSFTN